MHNITMAAPRAVGHDDVERYRVHSVAAVSYLEEGMTENYDKPELLC